MFAIDKNNDYILVGSKPSNMSERLESGVYNLDVRSKGPMSPPEIAFVKNNDYEKGVVINEGVFKEVREFFNDFFSDSMKEARKVMGMKNKLGVMFNGDPGTGKTFLAGQIAYEISKKHDAIGVLVTQSSDYSSMLDSIREDDPDRTIILIIDEFEKTFKSYDTDMLSFLSGARERDITIIIATVNDTNYLPNFIKDRPSRFEKTFEFTFNNEIVLKSIVLNILPTEYKNKLDLETLLPKIMQYKNMSIDRIKHILRDAIAAKLEEEKTGIKKEVIIKDDTSLKRAVITGFNLNRDDTTIYLNDPDISATEKLDRLIEELAVNAIPESVEESVGF